MMNLIFKANAKRKINTDFINKGADIMNLLSVLSINNDNEKSEKIKNNKSYGTKENYGYALYHSLEFSKDMKRQESSRFMYNGIITNRF